MVLILKKTKVQAAKKLKIKLETAKIIVKRYLQTGTIYEKKMADYSRKNYPTEDPHRTPAQIDDSSN